MVEELPPRLRDLLEPAARSAGLEAGAVVGRVWSRWTRIVGPQLARHVRPSSLRDGVLRVWVDSPVWATEIAYLGGHIRDRANEVAGREVVREVRVWTGSPSPSSGGDPVPGVGRVASPGAGAGLRGAREHAGPRDPLEAFGRALAAWRRARDRRPGGPESRPGKN